MTQRLAITEASNLPMNEYVFDFLICQFILLPWPDACSMRVPERDRVSQGGLLDVSPRSLTSDGIRGMSRLNLSRRHQLERGF